MNTFATRLKQAMNSRGMTLTSLHKKTEISKSSISSWLSGKYEAKQDKVFLLADALRVDGAWLMGQDVPMIKGEEQNKNATISTLTQKTTTIMNQLNPERQAVVYDTAKFELQAQNNHDLEFASEYEMVEEQGILTSYPNSVIAHIIKTTPVPRYGSLEMSAGVDSWTEDVDPPEMYDIPTSLLKHGVEFCAPINGESMQPNYPNGADALIKPLSDWQEGIGKVCAVWHDGGAYIKEIGDGRLISHNEVRNKSNGKRVYPDIIIHESSDTRIIGEVMGVYDSRLHDSYD